MLRIVRAFLVWLLVFAMPLQGWAVSSMRLCGSGHGGAKPVSVAPEARHHHHHDRAQGVQVLPDLAQDLAKSSQGATHGQHGCSACAACCHWLALPTDWVMPEASFVAQVRLTSPPPLVASHQPDGLDRPPRPPSA